MIYDVKNVLKVQAILGECPVWSVSEQVLYFADILSPEIHRFDPTTGEHRSIITPEHTGCFGFREKGGFIAAMRTGIFLLDQYGQIEKKVADSPTDADKSRFNDGRVDHWGRFWCGTVWEADDRNNGKLCRVDANLNCEVKAEDVKISNGLAFSPDKRWMFHTDTPNHVLYRYALNVDSGELIGEREIVRKFEKQDGETIRTALPDGGAFDSEGCYWSALFNRGKILRLSSEGDILDEILLPVKWPTMVAFGGKDLKTLFITSSREDRTKQELAQYPQSGDLFAVRVNVAGCEEPLFKESN